MLQDVNTDAMAIDHRLLNEMLDYPDRYLMNEFLDQTVKRKIKLENGIRFA